MYYFRAYSSENDSKTLIINFLYPPLSIFIYFFKEIKTNDTLAKVRQ